MRTIVGRIRYLVAKPLLILGPVCAVQSEDRERCPVEGVRRSSRGWRWLGFALVLLGWAAGSGPREARGQGAPSVVDVQSVYLFDFVKFLRWPAGGERQAITLCVAGPTGYADKLKQVVEGEKVDGHGLGVRQVLRPDGVPGCDVLFLSATLKDKLDPMLAASVGKPTLTVSDSPSFLDRGGMIQFTTIADRVRFAVDLDSVGKSGLGLSSELLKVAVKVRGATTPAGGEETP